MQYVVKNKLLKRLAQILIMFLFIYEIQLNSAPDFFTSRKIIAFITIASGIYKPKDMLKKIRDGNLFLAIVIYVMLITLIFPGTGEKILPGVVYFYLYVCIFPSFFKKYYKSIDELYTSFIGSGLIQSGIVFLQFFVKSFGKFLDKFFANAGNVEYTRYTRATGLGCEGATLGFFLAVSMMACAYFMVNKKNPVKYIIYYAIIFVAACLASRTGLLLGTVILVYALLYQAKKSVARLFIEVAVVAFIVYKVNGLINENISNMRVGYLMDWWKGIFDTKKGSSLYAISKMEIPPISFETIIGTGIRRGTSSAGTMIWNDMGYVQSYFAMGLICSILFYLSLLKKSIKKIMTVKDAGLKYILLFWLILIYVMEMKEPFIMKYIPVFLINMSYYVFENERESSKNA